MASFIDTGCFMETARLMVAAKEFMAFLIRRSGIHWLVREWICKNKISIIVYHDPSPQALESHLEYLRKHYNIIPLDRAVDAIYAGDLTRIPPKSLVITIDDGHAGNYGLLDLFKQNQIKPTIYLSSHIAGTRHGVPPDREYNCRPVLSRREIAEMAPWVDFQSHGRYHYRLTRCDEATARAEIAGSREAIAETFGITPDNFAYPYGDYSGREVAYLKACGYRSARTTDPGWNVAQTDPYRLKTLAMIPDKASKNMLCAQLSGLPCCVDYLAARAINRFRRRRYLNTR